MKLIETVRRLLFGTSTTNPNPAPAVQAEVVTSMSEAEVVETKRQRLYVILKEKRHLNGNYMADWKRFWHAIQYLIDVAETMEHLKKVVRHIDFASYSHHIDLEQLWKKWIEKATLAEEMEQMWEYRKWIGHGQESVVIRKWYAFATTFDQIVNIPCVREDEVLNCLIQAKKDKLAKEALEAAASCTELIKVWWQIEHNLRPTTLISHPSWDKDEDLDLRTIKEVITDVGSDTPLKKEADEKWLKVSLRKIGAAKLASEMRGLTSWIHPSAKASHTERWDLLSAAEVANATKAEDIHDAMNAARTGSAAQTFAVNKLETLNMEQVKNASTLEEFWQCLSKGGVLDGSPSSKLAIEKYIVLAHTEDQLRQVWSFTEELPEVRSLLVQKLSTFIK